MEMKIYAGIGSRPVDVVPWGLNQHEMALCRMAGEYLARDGWILRTGGAKGADQAFAEGAIRGGGQVLLLLPWASYEFEWIASMKAQGADIHCYVVQEDDVAAWQSVELYHKNSNGLSSGVRVLMARNWLILMGRQGKSKVDFCAAFPKVNQYGNLGGTSFGLTICAKKGILVRNFAHSDVAKEVIKYIQDKHQS